MKLVLIAIVTVIIAAVALYVSIPGAEEMYCFSNDWPAVLTDREVACMNQYL